MNKCHGRVFFVESAGIHGDTCYEDIKQQIRDVFKIQYVVKYFTNCYGDVPLLDFVHDDIECTYQKIERAIKEKFWQHYRKIIVIYDKNHPGYETLKKVIDIFKEWYQLEWFSDLVLFLTRGNVYKPNPEYISEIENESVIRGILGIYGMEEVEPVTKTKTIDLNKEGCKPKKNEGAKREKILKIIAGLQSQIDLLKAELEEI